MVAAGGGSAVDPPMVAWLDVEGPGGPVAIRCEVVEDPDPDESGHRQFWLEPVRMPERWERAVGLYLNVLPAYSVAVVRPRGD